MFECKAERIDRTLQTFQHVDAHQSAYALFTSAHSQTAVPLFAANVHVLLQRTWQYEIRRSIDGKIKFAESIVNLVITYGIAQVGQIWTACYRRKAQRKLSYVGSVVILLYVFSASSNGNAVEHFEEVEA